MSSDDLEFGGLAPTTPLVRLKERNLARSTKVPRTVDPGPSTKPLTGAPPKARRKTASDNVSSTPDIEEVIPAQGMVNGTGGAPRGRPRKKKGKGKDKVVLKNARPVSVEIETVEDEEDPPVDVPEAIDIDEPVREETPQPPAKRRKKDADPPKRNDAEQSRLAEKLHQAETQITNMARQLEELHELRTTEPETKLIETQMQYEATLQAQQILIEKLNAQLAQKQPLMSTGKTSILNLITRETADEEKRTLQREVDQLRKRVEESQRVIKEKDETIATMQQIEKELRFELKVEIDKGKALATKAGQPTPGMARHKTAVPDPKLSEVVRFYEDLTNLLITNVKPQPHGPDGDEWILTCIYTYADLEDSPSDFRKSLNFTLRTCEQTEADGSEEPIKSVHYLPLELDKEPEDFVAALGFLGQVFTFPREQLPIFLRTVYTHMGDATREKSDDSDGEDSVQLIEQRQPNSMTVS